MKKKNYLWQNTLCLEQQIYTNAEKFTSLLLVMVVSLRSSVWGVKLNFKKKLYVTEEMWRMIFFPLYIFELLESVRISADCERLGYLLYDTVSDKGRRLDARHHKINYDFFSFGDPPPKKKWSSLQKKWLFIIYWMFKVFQNRV